MALPTPTPHARNHAVSPHDVQLAPPLTLQILPPEIRREILHWLPIEGPTLKMVALLQKDLFDFTINSAMAHVTKSLNRLPCPKPVVDSTTCSKRELDLNDTASKIHLLLKRIVLKNWDLLPLIYKAAVYSNIFSANTSGYEELEYCEWRWHITNTTAANIVQVLIHSKFDLTVRQNRAFRWACDFEHVDAARCLLETGKVNPGDFNNYPLRVACNYGHLAMVQFLLSLHDPRIDAAADNNFAIGAASANGHSSVVAVLLQCPGVYPGASNNYSLRMSCRNNHADVVDLLLRDGRADPRAERDYALFAACQRGHVKVVERLLQDVRVDPAVDNNWAIKLASKMGHLACVQVLAADPRVDVCTDQGLAWALAISEGHVHVAEFLRPMVAALF
ncbi:ankyrin repeat-containing domain protein [Chytriomyces sp. MP71]|nr:ankyrin repeat-containing domain protein [Chytriomyces sp. MP71]